VVNKLSIVLLFVLTASQAQIKLSSAKSESWIGNYICLNLHGA